jgi:hypothetical protein
VLSCSFVSATVLTSIVVIDIHLYSIFATFTATSASSFDWQARR